MRSPLAALILLFPAVVCCEAPYGGSLDYQPPTLTTLEPGVGGNSRLRELAETAPATELRPGDTLSLTDCIALALRTNRQIRIADRQIDLARADEGRVSAGYWPTLNAAGTYQATVRNLAGSPVDFLEGSVTLQGPIFTFGKLEHGLRSAQAGTRAASLSAERTRQILAYQVSLAYFDVLEAWQAKAVTESSIATIEEQVRTAKTREKAGAGKRADVLAAEVQLAERRTELEVARTRMVVSLARLNRLLGVDVLAATQLVDVAKSDEMMPEVDVYTLLQAALANRPDLAALGASIDGNRESFSQSRADLLPTVSGIAKYSVNTAQPNAITNPTSDSFFLALQLEIPLFNMGTYADLRRKRLEIEDAIDTRAEALDDLVLDLTEVVASVRDATERIPVAHSAVELAEENLRLVNEEFRAGTRNSTDVLIEEDRLNQSRLTYFRAVYDYRRALAGLEATIAVDPASLSSSSD